MKDLKALSPPDADRVLAKTQAMTDDLAGDVKKLTNFAPEYRLRVGDWRVLGSGAALPWSLGRPWASSCGNEPG